jgi:hypothetical protein
MMPVLTPGVRSKPLTLAFATSAAGDGTTFNAVIAPALEDQCRGRTFWYNEPAVAR